MPLVVIEAEVAPMDNRVFGSSPSFLPPTALIPAWKPMVGLAETFGTTVIPEPRCKLSGFRPGWSRFRDRSPKSYCLYRPGLGGYIFLPWAPSESALSESGVPTCARAGHTIPVSNSVANAINDLMARLCGVLKVKDLLLTLIISNRYKQGMFCGMEQV